MTHGDNQGLVLPPRLAPYQVVIVPIYKNEDEKSIVREVTEPAKQALQERGISVHLDERDNLSPGYKFNDWELRGVPVRIEIGPRDVKKETVGLARRDVPGRDGKQFVPQAGLAQRVSSLLEDIQKNLLKQATAFRDEHIFDVTGYEEFKGAVKAGFARGWWAGSNEDELLVKEETGATLRCFPFEQPGGTGECFFTGRTAERVAIFGRAY